MDIKCNTNPYYFNKYYYPPQSEGTVFQGAYKLPPRDLRKSVDIFVRRPADAERAAGLSGIKPVLIKPKTSVLQKIGNYAKNYVKNIKHTYEHKVVFALVERELFGGNTIDSVTHDLDKMILYLLGFPKSFVSKFHRTHSAHHPESGKTMNLRSMLCDNIASSPEFKPEKKRSLREHYKTCKMLQNVDGFKNVLERYNYGENLNFQKINEEKDSKYMNLKGFMLVTSKLALLNLF